jgi:hypothetical protein
MYEALCRPSGTTLDILHAKGGPQITQRTLGLEEQRGIMAQGEPGAPEQG